MYNHAFDVLHLYVIWRACSRREPYSPVADSGFESGIGNWKKFAGEFSMDVTTEAAHSGKSSLKVGARQQRWTSPALDITSQLKAGGEDIYTVACFVKLVNAADESGNNGKISLIYRWGGNKNKGIVAPKVIAASDWTLMVGTMEVTDELLSDPDPITICFDSNTTEIYVDDVMLLQGEYSADDIQEMLANPGATPKPMTKPTLAPTGTILAGAMTMPKSASVTASKAPGADDNDMDKDKDKVKDKDKDKNNSILIIGIVAAGLVLIGGAVTIILKNKKKNSAAEIIDETEGTKGTEE